MKHFLFIFAIAASQNYVFSETTDIKAHTLKVDIQDILKKDGRYLDAHTKQSVRMLLLILGVHTAVEILLTQLDTCPSIIKNGTVFLTIGICFPVLEDIFNVLIQKTEQFFATKLYPKKNRQFKIIYKNYPTSQLCAAFSLALTTWYAQSYTSQTKGNKITPL